MAIVSIASAKGGCGKTTASLLIGTELALVHGYRVTLLDSDLNQHASAFGRKANVEGFSVIPSIDESNVLAALRAAEAEGDLVLIDLPGGTSVLSLKAMQRSHHVIVPAQASLLDVRDALKTVTQVDEAQELVRVNISRSLLWTRVPAGFESGSARHVRENLERGAISIMKAAIMERAAYREIHITGRVPRQEAPDSAQARNIAAVADELLQTLLKLAEAA